MGDMRLLLHCKRYSLLDTYAFEKGILYVSLTARKLQHDA